MPSCPFLLPLLLTSMGIASGSGEHDYTPSTSQYTEFFNAGVLGFDNGRALNIGFDNIEKNIVTYIADINDDGIEDLIFGKVGAYALSSVGLDQTVSYTLFTQVNRWDDNFHWTTAADLDNNGWPELIGRNSDSNEVTIAWINENEITTTEVESFPLLAYIEQPDSSYTQDGAKIVHEDFDSDGIPDLAFNTSQNAIVVRWSSRDEATQYQSYSSLNLLTDTVLYDPQDFNADGHSDILCLDTTTETFVFFAGTGTDTLAAPVPFTIPVSGHVANANYPYFGNLDSNPELDLVIYDETNNVNKLIPNFMQSPSTVIALIADPQAEIYAIPGDLDNSGSDDILFQHRDPNSTIHAPTWITTLITDPLSPNTTSSLINVGNPSQDETTHSIVNWYPKALAVQLDQEPGNEILWLGSAYLSSNVNRYADSGFTKVFTSFRATSPNTTGPLYGSTKLPAHPIPTFVIANNLDNDQTDELFITGNGKGRLINLAQGTNEQVNQVNGALKSIVADLGNNGSRELVLSGVGQHIMVHPINPDGTLGNRVGYRNPNDTSYGWIHYEDFDNDGLPDILAKNSSHAQLHFYKALPDGTLVAPVITESIQNHGSYLATIDANNDPFPDVVCSSYFEISIYINNTDGTFSPAPSEPIQTPFPPYWFDTADMDLDGNTDIIHVSQDGLITIHYLDENNESSELRKLSIQNARIYLDLTIEDMNNDGYPDLLASTGTFFNSGSSDQTQAIWVRTDHREYQVQAILPAPSTEAMTLGHFNDDNILDLATVHGTDDSVRIHWGAEPPTSCPADLNNDNALDFFDISQFLSTTPDFNNDGAFDFFDISDYLTSYSQGCP